MVKTAKKVPAKKKVTTKKVDQNVRIEAKSRNLDFLTDLPKGNSNPRSTTRSVQTKENGSSKQKVTSATRASSTKRCAVRVPLIGMDADVSADENRCQLDLETDLLPASSAKRLEIRDPLIDMDADYSTDDNQHQQRLNLKTDLLNDWISDLGSEEGDYISGIDVEEAVAKVGDYEPESDCDTLPNHVKRGRTEQSAVRALKTSSASVVHREASRDLSSVGKSSAIKKTYTRKNAVVPQSDAKTLANKVEQTSTGKTVNQISSSSTGATSDSSVCVCGHQPKIDELVKQKNALVSQNKKLQRSLDESNTRCLTLTDSLNAKILGTPRDVTFTEVEGFPDKEKLKKFSQAAGKRDYIFVKLLMLDIFPEGLQNKTVTGRTSNNPNGRKGGQRSEENEALEKECLGPEKVKYIEGRFVEHCRYQGISEAVAAAKMKECRGLMAQAISYYGKK